MKRQNGFISLEMCIALFIFLLFTAVALPKLSLCSESLYIDYLAWKLSADLRASQYKNMGLPREGSLECLSSAVRFLPDRYILNIDNGKRITFYLPPHITLRYNRDNVIYFDTGCPYTYRTASIRIIGRRYRRTVVINSYGRIRHYG